MRWSEIAPYVDLDRIEKNDLRQIRKALKGMPDQQQRSALLTAMYGDEAGELELELQRIALQQAQLDLDKTSAETSRQRAAAISDLASAED